jgi:hypothetical protein
MRRIAGRVIGGLLAVVGVGGCQQARADDGRTELLSIVGVPLGPNEFIKSFDIKTQGVTILAACHVPSGWRVSLGYYDSVDGEMEGHDGLGASAINRSPKSLAELGNLFLVRVYKYTDRWDGLLRPTYRGRVSIGRYGTLSASRSYPLRATNISRKPGPACPPMTD